MLQRAASNAYSWWWASHIRTKQSKWLEQNLQDMEEKVQTTLKLIEEDGDSFAKRAEMYYKKRPELISFVEESYRAYRSLAERYDHISTELQNANHTLATVFPEQVQLSMDEEDEDAAPRLPKKTPAPTNIPKNIPKAPKDPLKELKVIFSSATASKKLKSRTTVKSSIAATIPKSGLTKPQAVEEIDKLQKEILSLQTEKEFVKSSYDSSLAKYWEIDEHIKHKHERICKLQDEFGASMVIEDDEARSLMAAAALRSCHETLAQLQEKQEKTTKDANIENKRVREFWGKLNSMKNEFRHGRTDREILSSEATESTDRFKSSDEEEERNSSHSRQDLDLLREKIKEHIEAGFGTSLSVTEMAEKIDELVNKVISLETAISSQTALMNRLRAENDDLQSQIRILEDGKESIVNDTGDMSKRLREMEVKCRVVEELSKNVEDQNNNLQTHFTEAQCNLDHLSEKLCTIKPDAELEINGLKSDAGLEINCPSPREESPLVEATVKEEEAKENEINLISGSEDPQIVNPENEPGVTRTSTIDEVNLKEELNGQKDTVELDTSQRNMENMNPDKELKVEDFSVNDVRSFKEFKPQERKEEQKTLDLGKVFESTDMLVTSPIDMERKEVQSLGEGEPENHSKNFMESNIQGKTDDQASSETPGDRLDTGPQKQAAVDEDEPDWRELFINGMENREKVLLNEYTAVLRNYKDVKKKLTEVEKNPGSSLTDTQIRDLKSANAMKDDEIRSLRRKVSLMHRLLDENKDVKELHTPTHHRKSNLLDDVNIDSLATTTFPQEEEESGDIELAPIEEWQSGSAIELKFRMNLDELLEQNLDFWLRFSTSFGQIQKFESEVQDLQAELLKIEERGKKQEGSSSAKYNLKSDIRPIYKHLSEIYTELSVWLEKSVLLKDELKSRFSSLCDIQEEIKTALRESAEEDDFTFTSYQAAKFQGEVLNMKQENNKVADELQSGLDHVTTLQLEVEKTLAKLNEEFSLSGSKKEVNPQLIHSDSRSRIPLRSFIFGVKPKRQKQSLFACVSPVLYRKHNHRPGNSL